jgi:pimeloyl-ACP methyl ester carboxylesterase
MAGVVVLVVACMAAGCSSTPKSVAIAPTTHHVTATSAATTTTEAPLPVTPIAWSSCNGDLQCGTLTVPLDYAKPDGTTIGIAVERHPAEVPADRIGSLVINPGGPGVSGIDDFANELSVLTPGLLDDFDIVTFDPRGVQRSDPVTCGEHAAPATSTTTTMATATPAPVAPDPVPQTAAAQKADFANLHNYGQDCLKASRAILPFVGTVDVARDLERLRIALGDAGLTFMGQSYGTLLGETYAQMYPTHIRAMVLDSVIDPALTLSEMTLGQAKGFEAILQSFFAWCAANSSCPWRPAGNPTTALLAQLTRSAANPVPAGAGQRAGAGELYDALLDGLYSQSEWPVLGAALAADAAGNGAPVLAMSGHYDADGSTNGADASEAINCLDHPAPTALSAYPDLASILGQAAPVFGPLLAWGEASCAEWPVPPTRTPAPVTAAGSPPILVIGTTADPATPYAWAVSVSHELQHGVLLTVEGDDHVSYFYSACVRSDVQAYVISGATPSPTSTCAD